MAHVQLPIDGMTCAACSARLERALSQVVGVQVATVNLATERADLDYDAARIDVRGLIDAVVDAGFDVPPRAMRLRVAGMTCASCAARVEAALQAVPGVVSARVNPATDLADVAAQADVRVDALTEAVAAAGYGAEPAPSSAAERDAEARRWEAADRREQQLLWACAALTVPLVAPMLLMPFDVHWMPPGWLQATLATAVQLLGGTRFLRGALVALRGGSANMDVLVTLGTTTALLTSAVGLATDGPLYFEASASIVTLVRLGKRLEGRARRATGDALRALEALRPEEALVDVGGRTVAVPVAAVGAGQRVLVAAGARVPVDGEIVEGTSSLDESLVTGEAEPVPRGLGDRVLAGSTNGAGPLWIRARGGEGTVDALARRVQEAVARQPPVQRLVDRVSAVFVPAVLLLSGVAGMVAWWSGAGVAEAWMRAVAVQVIACPCALGLATPTALVAGAGAAARRGILIRDGDVLQQASDVDVVVFDKTGTLTAGRPEVRRVRGLGIGDQDLLAAMAALQAGGSHPLAGAIARACALRNLDAPPATAIETVPGRGVTGVIQGQQWSVGSPRMATERSGQAVGTPETDAAEAAGETVVWATRDGAVVGWLSATDPLRDGAADAVAELRRRGIEVWMLTGDRRAVAESVARQVGIEGIIAEVLPDDKADRIAAWVSAGRRVAMVGDGVNDAPALATATVGIAMSTGADVAVHSAHVVLMRADPRLVPEALNAATATLRTIRENLFFAFVYNVLVLPVAAAGYLSPGWASAAMALSSVSVVSNALRLRGLGRVP